MSSRIYKQALALVVISIASKVLGFLREFLLAYRFGATYITDAYIAANTLTITFIGGFVGAFFTAYLPIYSSIAARDKNQGDDYNSKLLTLVLLVALTSIIGYFAINDVLVRAIAPGFSTEGILLTKRFADILIISVLLSAIRSVVGGYLQYHNRVELVYSSMYIIMNIFVVLSIVLSSLEKPEVMAYGYLFGAILSGLILTRSARKLGFKYRPKLDLKDRNIRDTLLMLGPIFINIAMMDINTLVDRVIGSFLGEGVVSSLAYAHKVNEIMVVLLATALGQAMFPYISKLIAASKTEEALGVVKQGLSYTTMIVLPISALMATFSKQIITLLFFRGAFTNHNLVITSQTLVAYSIGMLFYAYRQVLYRVFLSLRMSKNLMFNSIVNVLINVGLSLLLYKRFEHMGLAISTSLATAIMCIVMLLQIDRKIIPLRFKENIWSFVKMMFATAVMLVSAITSYKFVLSIHGVSSGNIAFILSIVGAGVVYLLVLGAMRTKELEPFLSSLFAKLGSLRRSKGAR